MLPMHSGTAYTQLSETDAFVAYRDRLIEWAEGGAGADNDRELRHASRLLHDEVHTLGLLPEHALIALHAGGALEAIMNRLQGDREAVLRYAEALSVLSG